MLIDQNFLHWECINSILVSAHVHIDLLIWPLTSDGCYSVRYAYKLLANAQCQDQPSSSNIEAAKGLWNGMWKFQVPNKVRHFIWWVVNKALPTKINLFKRHVIVDGTCELCEDELKDSAYALWFCDCVKPIWMTDSSFLFIKTKKFLRFDELFLFVLQNVPPKKATLFAMIAWSIWEWQNKLRERQSTWDIGECFCLSFELTEGISRCA